jgi:hypothetical protein
MTPGESDSAERVLVEVQVFDMPGRILADGRFVLEVKDGIGRLVEPLRSLGSPMDGLRLDLRISEADEGVGMIHWLFHLGAVLV